jgi:hypothetical protein
MGNSFSTIWTSWKNERPDTPATIIEGEATILSYNRTLMTDTIEVEAANHSRMEIQRLYYPGWKVFINGTQAIINYQEQGTLIISLPPGRSVIITVFQETPLRLLANSISILAFAILVLRRWYFRYEHRH